MSYKKPMKTRPKASKNAKVSKLIYPRWKVLYLQLLWTT